MFSPYDPATWRENSEDCVIPPHELDVPLRRLLLWGESLAAVADELDAIEADLRELEWSLED